MSVTDPVFTERHAASYPELDKPPKVILPVFVNGCLLCVSLTPLFNGFHYKVVAAVLEMP